MPIALFILPLSNQHKCVSDHGLQFVELVLNPLRIIRMKKLNLNNQFPELCTLKPRTKSFMTVGTKNGVIPDPYLIE